ncbi:hypothetical protein Tco_0150141 [Tanacetum coccineum]
MNASGGSGSNSPVWMIVDDNGAVDINVTMDNLEERLANLEMVFAYLKNKKMLERQENKPKKGRFLIEKGNSSAGYFKIAFAPRNPKITTKLQAGGEAGYDIGSTEFTIYEMMKRSSVWLVRYLVNIVQLLNPLPEGWSIRTGVWSICLGDGEGDGLCGITYPKRL